MANWVALSAEKHRNSRFWVPDDMRHTAAFKLVPVLKAELRRAVSQYVLAFAEIQNQMSLVALLGAAGKQHLYLDFDGSWHGSYVPATLRGYPFQLLSLDEDRFGLSIDADVLSTDPEVGRPVFNDQGGLSDEVERYTTFLKHCHISRVETDEAVKMLQDHDLLCPWVKETHDPAQPKGLFQIDMARFDALPSDEVAELKGGPLAIAYAQIYARGHLDALLNRAQALKQTPPQATPRDAPHDTMRPDFLEGIGEETLVFDFGD